LHSTGVLFGDFVICAKMLHPLSFRISSQTICTGEV